jgi:uncharacterized protein with von Willebrand factor type A (vWA) domain
MSGPAGRGVAAELAGDRLVAVGVLGRVERLAGELRATGADVALSEVLDATEALRHIDLGRREELRAALRCVLVKYPHHNARFDAAFDRAFPARPPGPGAPVPGPDVDDATAATLPASGRPGPGTLDTRIRAAVDGAALDELRILAEEAVDRHGGFDAAARTERYHVYRVLRAIDLARLLHDAIRRARERGDQVDRAELAARVEALRRLVTEQVRARLADLGPAPGGDVVVPALDVDIVRASASQLDEMREAVRPLVRRLAARLRLRRQSARTGRVDMRRTARRSVATGGVPLDVVYRRRRAHKPELFSLCDVSGSVADFSGFTLTLISALAGELSGTRTFAFVDAVDEITELAERASTPVEPWQILQRGRVIGADGHSDYGAVLTEFWERYGRAGLTHRSTVVIAGDARGNYRPDRAELLGTIARRARAVYWLDPEPRAEWGSTDSVLAAYAPHCDRVFEVRTLRQLAAAVEAIL